MTTIPRKRIRAFDTLDETISSKRARSVDPLLGRLNTSSARASLVQDSQSNITELPMNTVVGTAVSFNSLSDDSSMDSKQMQEQKCFIPQKQEQHRKQKIPTTVTRQEPRKVSMTMVSTSSMEEFSLPNSIVTPSPASTFSRTVTESSSSSNRSESSSPETTIKPLSLILPPMSPHKQSNTTTQPWYHSLLWMLTVVLFITNFCTYGMLMQTQLEQSRTAVLETGVVLFEPPPLPENNEISIPEVNVTKEEWLLLQDAWQQAVEELEDMQSQLDHWQEAHANHDTQKDFLKRLSVLEAEGHLQCVDEASMDCSDWALAGECSKNPRFMEWYCRKSCQVCGVKNEQ